MVAFLRRFSLHSLSALSIDPIFGAEERMADRPRMMKVAALRKQSQARPGLRPQAPPAAPNTNRLCPYPLVERDSLLRRDRATDE